MHSTSMTCSFVTLGLMSASAVGTELMAEPCAWKTLVAAFGVPEDVGMAAPAYDCSSRTWLCGQVSSTFAVARHVRLEPWSGVLAISQHAGRGQLGRPWISPPGNLYATLGLPANGPFTTDMAALAAGYLVAQALAKHDIWMKWPNDLIMRQNGVWRKVGGLLIEARDGLVHLGLGLNLVTAPDDRAMRRDRAFPAGTLTVQGSLWSLWTELVHSMRAKYSELVTLAAPDWIATMLTRMAFVGDEVEVGDPPAAPLTGRFTGLDASGGVCLHSPDGDCVAQAGSLRLLSSTQSE